MSILQDILRATEGEVSRRRADRPLADLKRMIADAPPVRSLYTALSNGFSLIAEIKARSPSAGEMDPGNVVRAAKAYENTPAVSTISVLTQESFFGGSVGLLGETRERVSKPILRKDFIRDEYQVWEARAFGADAILLMASLFVRETDGREKLRSLFELARSLGMEALVEIGMSGRRPISEMAAIVPEEAEIWGVNSRKFLGSRLQLRWRVGRLLGTDLTTSSIRHERLRQAVPARKIAVAESGIDDPQELEGLSAIGYHAALIGTAFLKRGVVIEEVTGLFADSVRQIRTSHAAAPVTDRASTRGRYGQLGV